MATIDLDKRRAERDEKPHTVTLDGDEWELPNPLPLVVAQDLASGDFRSVIRGTFGSSAANKRAADAVVARLEPLLDDDSLSEMFGALYDIGARKAKKGK
jgi:hypothetical protein